ncbi:hypothetical protein BH11MYX2_BH11MYX2_32870 [soil metagenome]
MNAGPELDRCHEASRAHYDPSGWGRRRRRAHRDGHHDRAVAPAHACATSGAVRSDGGARPIAICATRAATSRNVNGARRKLGDVDGASTPPTSCSGSDPVTKPIQRTSLIVHPTLDVKTWIARPPSSEAARPGRCPRCGAASRPTGAGLGLHGHGIRDRAVFGPPDADAGPDRAWVSCRRYRCVVGTCRAVILVVPRGVAPRRHYSLAAIAMAMTLWGILALTPVGVRERICVSPSVAWGDRNQDSCRVKVQAASDGVLSVV